MVVSDAANHNIVSLEESIDIFTRSTFGKKRWQDVDDMNPTWRNVHKRRSLCQSVDGTKNSYVTQRGQNIWVEGIEPKEGINKKTSQNGRASFEIIFGETNIFGAISHLNLLSLTHRHMEEASYVRHSHNTKYKQMAESQMKFISIWFKALSNASSKDVHPVLKMTSGIQTFVCYFNWYCG